MEKQTVLVAVSIVRNTLSRNAANISPEMVFSDVLDYFQSDSVTASLHLIAIHNVYTQISYNMMELYEFSSMVPFEDVISCNIDEQYVLKGYIALIARPSSFFVLCLLFFQKWVRSAEVTLDYLRPSGVE